MNRIKRTTALGVATAVAVVGAGAGMAFGVDNSKEVRQSQFLPGVSDTRANGHYDFLEEGLAVYTDGSGDTGPRTDGAAGTWNTDKVAEYFAVDKTLAEVGEPTLSWRGTDARPGMQLGVDLDADGTQDGILVGEPRFYADRWWANSALNSFIAGDAGNTAPGANDGYAHSGPLDDWRSAYPDAKVVSYGFSLGSGVKGDGVITRMTLGSQEYIFTDEAPDAATGTTDPPPAQGPREVHTSNAKPTGTGTFANQNRLAAVQLKTNALPADNRGAGKVSWQIKVQGVGRFSSTQGFGEVQNFRWAFSKKGGAKKVEIFRNGRLYKTAWVTTK